MSDAQRTLDQVYSVAHLEAFEPGAYLDQLAAELGSPATLDELAARDAMSIAALAAIDTMIARAMKLRLDQALALEASVPAVTRNVFATTIIQYASRLELLGQRVHDVAARGGAPHPGDVADAVLDAARAVLGLRETLRAGVLELIRERAAASVAEADHRARDRALDDAKRKQWSRMRRDLEALAADPSGVFAGPSRARLAAYPEQLDDAPAEPELSFADLIELD
ncbi:MAG: hypothetical protein ABI591_22520 [Kofleriaceae bacterium]